MGVILAIDLYCLCKDSSVNCLHLNCKADLSSLCTHWGKYAQLYLISMQTTTALLVATI